MDHERAVDSVIETHTGQSIFDKRGDLRQQFQRDGAVAFGEYLHISSIPWAPEPNGAEHSQWLSKLAEYMAELPESWGGVGPFDKHDRKVLHAVAMLYAVGKGSLGRDQPPLGEHGYEARSAAFAEQFFRDGGGANTYWARDDVRDDVCRLLYKHNRPDAIASDKRLQVFSDALRYEVARFRPQGDEAAVKRWCAGEGVALIREHCRPEMFFAPWARNVDNIKTWLGSRGWR